MNASPEGPGWRHPDAEFRSRGIHQMQLNGSWRSQHLKFNFSTRWWKYFVELSAIRSAAADAEMVMERTVGEGTEFCGVLLRRA